MGPWRTVRLPKPCSPSFLGWTLTRAFLAALALGPFHWIISLPRSSRKTSLLLKLCQESSTCEGQGQGGDRGSYCLDPGKGPQPAPAHVSKAQVCHLCAASSMSVVWYVWCRYELRVDTHRCKHVRPRGSLCGCGWVRLWVSVTTICFLSQGVRDWI